MPTDQREEKFVNAPIHCAWCGATTPDQRWRRKDWWRNRDGEWFCNPSHRSAGNAAKRRDLPDAD